MAEQNIEKGDQVSWAWGSGRPAGEVAEVKEKGEIAIESDKGNTIKRNAEPADPAVHVAREGNDVVKRAHELEVEEKADGGAVETNGASAVEKKSEGEAEEKVVEKKSEAVEQNGEAKTGEKRDRDAVESNEDEKQDSATVNGETKSVDDKKEDEPAAKKQKKDNTKEKEEKEDTSVKKGRGRPKGGKAVEKPKKEPKRAATEDGQPRRSARHKTS